MAHPEVAYRSCEDCKRWMYDAKTGKREMRKRTNTDTGEVESYPLARKPGTKTPCWNCPKCEIENPKLRTPEDGVGAELSRKNWKALRFYFQQKAVGGRVDAIARRNCGLIEWILEEHRMRQNTAMIDLSRAK